MTGRDPQKQPQKHVALTGNQRTNQTLVPRRAGKIATRSPALLRMPEATFEKFVLLPVMHPTKIHTLAWSVLVFRNTVSFPTYAKGTKRPFYLVVELFYSKRSNLSASKSFKRAACQTPVYHRIEQTTVSPSKGIFSHDHLLYVAYDSLAPPLYRFKSSF